MATYFVKNGGSDGADGLSDANAWATLSKVSGITFVAGDTIQFKCGSVWRESVTIHGSGSSGNPITITSYDTGTLPTFSGANVVSGFSNGGSNIWDATVTTSPNVVIVNGVLGVKVASRAACTSPGNWFWTSNTLSVFATSDPSGLVESGTRAAILQNQTQSWWVLSNFIVYGSNTSNGINFSSPCNNMVLTNVTSKWNGSSGSNGYLMRNQTTLTLNSCSAIANVNNGFSCDVTNSGVTFNSCSSSSNGRHGYFFALTSNVTFNGGSASSNGTSTVEGNGIHVSQANAALACTNYTINSFSSHDNFGNGFDSFTTTPSDSGNSGITIIGGTWYNNLNGAFSAAGIRFDERTNNSVVKYAICYGNESAGIVSEAASFNNTFLYNVVYDNANGLLQSNSVSTGNVWYGNISYGNTSAGFAHSGSAASAIVKNNIFMNNGAQGYFTDGTGSADVVDYNLVFGNTTNYSGISKPTHDVNSDPLLVDGANNDFRLGVGSPAIGAGTNVGSPYNIGLDNRVFFPWVGGVGGYLDQNLYPTQWTIGPFVVFTSSSVVMNANFRMS